MMPKWLFSNKLQGLFSSYQTNKGNFYMIFELLYYVKRFHKRKLSTGYKHKKFDTKFSKK